MLNYEDNNNNNNNNNDEKSFLEKRTRYVRRFRSPFSVTLLLRDHITDIWVRHNRVPVYFPAQAIMHE